MVTFAVVEHLVFREVILRKSKDGPLHTTCLVLPEFTLHLVVLVEALWVLQTQVLPFGLLKLGPDTPVVLITLELALDLVQPLLLHRLLTVFDVLLDAVEDIFGVVLNDVLL